MFLIKNNALYYSIKTYKNKYFFNKKILYVLYYN